MNGPSCRFRSSGSRGFSLKSNDERRGRRRRKRRVTTRTKTDCPSTCKVEKRASVVDSELDLCSCKPSICALSRLCLTSHPSEAPAPRGSRHNALFEQVRDALADTSVPTSASLAHPPHDFIYDDAPEASDLQSLIDGLPSRKHMDSLFLTAPPHTWAGIHLVMFGPGWREVVEEIYDDIEDGKVPAASRLANLFGFLCWITRETESKEERNSRQCDTVASDYRARQVIHALQLNTEGASLNTVRAHLCLVLCVRLPSDYRWRLRASAVSCFGAKSVDPMRYASSYSSKRSIKLINAIW